MWGFFLFFFISVIYVTSNILVQFIGHSFLFLNKTILGL